MRLPRKAARGLSSFELPFEEWSESRERGEKEDFMSLRDCGQNSELHWLSCAFLMPRTIKISGEVNFSLKNVPLNTLFD
jgi:hypothetical protein